ncbi:FAD-dependent oxidoreductase [Sphingomonas sp. 37zxx]|uniref:FAD-dependent oxidoreductase n=1 Tax=Sphingomonas sp. 37zxx TaxID=1550073 RepID=UPI00053BF188|nr:FAD-dependent oxidoreductase [Sphingomonas sp. 37zxx]
MAAPHHYDFVVAGSGGGGLVAAITARMRGLSVLLLEKEALLGGSSAISGGIVWIPDNPVMKREGQRDSVAEAMRYVENFTQDNGHVSPPTRRRAFLEAGPRMVTLLEDCGMQFEYCAEYADYYAHLPGGHQSGRSLQGALFDLNDLGPWKARFRINPSALPVRTSEGRHLFLMKRTLKGAETATRLATRVAKEKVRGTKVVGSGGSLIGRLLQIAIERGVDIRVDAPLTDFVIEDGRVAGVQTVLDGAPAEVRAGHGVLVAAGGFARNAQMRARYQPQPSSVDWTKANPGDTGEAIERMEALGAELACMDQAWWIPTSIPPGIGPVHNVADISKPFGILVDAAGNRFANESASYMEIGHAIYARNATASTMPAWYVMDARHRSHYPWFRTPPGMTPSEWTESGWMKQGRTIEELALACGIDPAGLQATVARFNGFCKTGVDLDYHRGENAYARYFADPTVKPNGNLGPIEKAPFQAIPIWPGDGGTAGGVIADPAARVLRADGTAIDGLYATGNCTAPVYGPHYTGAGCSIGASFVGGYLAAMDAADRAQGAAE